MDQQPSDMSAVLQGDARAVEESLKALWDRVRRAAEAILQLREERRVLAGKVEQLELEIQQLRQELEAKEQLISSKALEQAQREEPEQKMFSDGEREAMANRVRDLLARLDNYL